MRELTVSGNRFLWTDGFVSNSSGGEDLRTASLPRPHEHTLASAGRGDGNGIGGIVGTWIGGLVGAGNLLAVNRWSTNANGVVTRSELDVISGRRLRRVVSGPNAIFAQSIDSGRIAVLRQRASVGIYDERGKLLREVEPSSTKASAFHTVPEVFDTSEGWIALRGNQLLVLTGTGTLEVYDSRSGAYLRSWPVPKGAMSLDAYAGVAVYADSGPEAGAGPFKVHGLQLATGKDVVLARGTRWPTRGLALGAGGLVYAKNPFTLVFVPLTRVLAAVS